jgi:hypothetical protein
VEAEAQAVSPRLVEAALPRDQVYVTNAVIGAEFRIMKQLGLIPSAVLRAYGQSKAAVSAKVLESRLTGLT